MSDVPATPRTRSSDDPPLPPRPRQARGAVARDRVYVEAVRQFAEHGVDATRIEDVVAAAGVAWGTFYRWFPRKQDVLLEAAVRHVREHVAPVVAAGLVASDQAARTTALAFFTTLLGPRDHPPRLHGAMLQEVLAQRERFTAMLGEDEQPLVQTVAQLVAHGQQRGEVRGDVDPFTLAGTLLAGTAFPIMYAYAASPPGALSADVVAEQVERVFGIVWRGFEPAPAAIR